MFGCGSGTIHNYTDGKQLVSSAHPDPALPQDGAASGDVASSSTAFPKKEKVCAGGVEIPLSV